MSALSVFLKGAAKKLVEDGAELAVKKDAKKAAGAGAKLAVKKAERKALPAPAKRLALPAPDPARDNTYARWSRSETRPHGGQWLPDATIVEGNDSPENAARQLARRVPDESPLRSWAVKAIPRYVKRDMGAHNDPLRALAEQGHVAGIANGDEWTSTANSLIGIDPAEYYMGLEAKFGKTPSEAARIQNNSYLLRDIAEQAPWIAKMPSTDPVYSLYGSNPLNLEPFTHTIDELHNATRAGTDVPPHLQLDEGSLQRMSWPQGVERAGMIDKWRAAQMEAERANIVASNPAFAVHKEYPDDPRGLRWMQIKMPEYDENVAPDGWHQIEGGLWRNSNATGAAGDSKYSDDHPAARTALKNLESALKNEGDAMGHCVGGYCRDVASGDSGIYTLRDAKGEPHVTIETSPANFVYSDVAKRVGAEQASQWLDEGLTLHDMLERAGGREALGLPDDSIVQIKGKQNAKPIADYIPYVQDFIRSRDWSQIGDLRNADMARLLGKYVPRDEYDTTMKGYKDAVLAHPGGRAMRRFNNDMPQWGTPEFEEADSFLGKALVPYEPGGPGAYSFNELYSIFTDPGAYGDDILEDAMKAVETLPNHPIDVPPHLYEGYAKGGFVVKRKASCDCGCGDLALRRAA